MADTLDRALALAEHGFRVFPLEPGGKRPALEMPWQEIATSDPATIRARWIDPITGWAQPFNIGVALPPDIAVVDVDVRDGRKGQRTLQALEAIHDPLPNTYRVRTSSRGDHHYFRITPGEYGGALGENVDFKHHGGYVVGEGSVIGGIAYSAVGGSAPDALVDLPDEFADLARAAPRRKPRAAGVAGAAPIVEPDRDDAVARAIAWLEAAEPALEGDGGDRGTYAVAARVMDFGISPDLCTELMLDHWNDRCSPPWPPEKLAVKVANAARYRTSPIGVASPAADFGAEPVSDRPHPREVLEAERRDRPKLYYEKFADVRFATRSAYLIRHWYDRGGMIVTYGESGSGKTHIVLDQAMAVASGTPWAGEDTARGLVVYVAAEGSQGIRKRVVAHRARKGGEDVEALFALVPCPIDLLRPSGDTGALVDLVHAAEADFGAPCSMVVIDTLSRALAGGNENAPDDMGALVKHCDRIRSATGAALHIIHHSGKNKAAGARGHSLLRAATDTEIEIANGEIVVTKQRDMDFARPLTFRLEQVRLGQDDEGVAITTALPAITRAAEFETRVSEGAQRLLDTLVDLARGSDTGAVSWAAWLAAGMEFASRATLFRYRSELEDAGLVSQLGSEDTWISVIGGE